MSRIRVLDLAKELGLDTKSAILKLQEVGIQVKNHFNAISDIEADKLRVFVRTGKNPEKEAASRSSSKVVIRRRPSDTVSDTAAEGSSTSSEGQADSQGGREEDSAWAKDDSFVPAIPQSASSSPDGFARTEDSMAEGLGKTPAEWNGAKSQVDALNSVAPNLGIGQPAVSTVADKPPAQMQSKTGSSAENAEFSKQNESPAMPASASLQTSQDGNELREPAESANQKEGKVLSKGIESQKGAPAAPSQVGLSPRQGGAKENSASGSTGQQGGTVIVRREGPAPQASANTPGVSPAVRQGNDFTAAVVVRRAPDQAPAPQARPPAYPQQTGRGDFNRSQPGNGGGFSGGGNSAYPQQPRQEGSTGGYRQQPPREGGFQPREGGFQPRQQEGGRGINPAGPQVRQPGGFGPRPAGAPGSGPRPGGFGPRPEGGGFPRSGGISGGMRIGGGAPTAFVITDSPAQKEGRARAEKEREVKRRTHGDEEPKKAGAAVKGKGRFDPNALPEEEYEFTGEEEVAPGAVPNVRTVYTPVPNRKRAGGARKKDHRKDASLSANPTKASKKIVRIDESVTVNDLAGMLSVKATAIIKSLMGLGMMAGVNQILDFETATIVIQEFGFEAHNATVSLADIFDTKKHGSKAVHAGDAITRPPVVTIMGHVDHGKTSLLDVIRSANVAGGEKGGITQHIGAYQVEYNGRKLTFLDTPGHEAFTAMRSRGAQVTDVVILVVAADDGVMPQTVEAIAHAKAAGVPIIVAINKIDKQGVNLDRLYRELADQAVISEEWGGDCMFVKVSAKTKEGIPDLLESIVLQADVLDLKTPAEGLSSGIVIEAKLDKSRGPVATVIVTQGILKVSDWLVAGQTYGRIRAMFDDKGERLNEAGPSTPVEILGLSEVPAAGDQFNCVVNDSVAKEAVSYRIEKQRQKDLASQPKATLEDLLARMSAENVKTIELPLIIKADTQGSVEAIRSSVKKLDTEKVKVKILHGAVGGITETDVTLGMASGALVVGFNVRPDRVAAQIAEREGVPLQCFGIIYELIDSVQNAMVGKLAPVKMEKFLGRAEVRSLFSVPKIGVIAGTAVLDGKITRNSHMRVIRDNVVIYTGRVSSLKRFKDDAKEVVQGFECGIGVENYNDLKIGDVLEAFVIEEVAATLH